jgi:hypothetical protein
MPFEQLLASCVEVLSNTAQKRCAAREVARRRDEVRPPNVRPGSKAARQLAAAGIAPSFEAIRFAETKPDGSATLKGFTPTARARFGPE